MGKRRSEMTSEELEAVREYDRQYWHAKRKSDEDYMELKRTNDRLRRRDWYKKPANAEHHRIAMRERMRKIRSERRTGASDSNEAVGF